MPKVKITVVKGFSAEEVFGDDIPDYFPERFRSPCWRHTEGQTFIAEKFNCPEGFCNWAYADIQKDIADLELDSPYYDRWMRGKRVQYVSCTDGMRPVVFKLERIVD
jgi:uncharacterized repeat protein (TIGR04076 family)